MGSVDRQTEKMKGWRQQNAIILNHLSYLYG
jgi:hypothetical protein